MTTTPRAPESGGRSASRVASVVADVAPLGDATQAVVNASSSSVPPISSVAERRATYAQVVNNDADVSTPRTRWPSSTKKRAATSPVKSTRLVPTILVRADPEEPVEPAALERAVVNVDLSTGAPLQAAATSDVGAVAVIPTSGARRKREKRAIKGGKHGPFDRKLAEAMKSAHKLVYTHGAGWQQLSVGKLSDDAYGAMLEWVKNPWSTTISDKIRLEFKNDISLPSRVVLSMACASLDIPSPAPLADGCEEYLSTSVKSSGIWESVAIFTINVKSSKVTYSLKDFESVGYQRYVSLLRKYNQIHLRSYGGTAREAAIRREGLLDVLAAYGFLKPEERGIGIARNPHARISTDEQEYARGHAVDIFGPWLDKLANLSHPVLGYEQPALEFQTFHYDAPKDDVVDEASTTKIETGWLYSLRSAPMGPFVDANDEERRMYATKSGMARSRKHIDPWAAYLEELTMHSGVAIPLMRFRDNRTYMEATNIFVVDIVKVVGRSIQQVEGYALKQARKSIGGSSIRHVDENELVLKRREMFDLGVDLQAAQNKLSTYAEAWLAAALRAPQQFPDCESTEHLGAYAVPARLENFQNHETLLAALKRVTVNHRS